METNKTCFYKRVDCVRSKYDSNHLKVNIERDNCVLGGDLYDRLMSMGVFSLRLNKIFHMCSVLL